MQSHAEIDSSYGRFAIPGIAKVVAGQGGLPKVHITTAQAEADIYIHGAHVTSWHPKASEEVIFLSEHSRWEDGRAIRGGIPVCFPWFRAKADDASAPSHGFARIKSWNLDSITNYGDVVVVTLSTESDESTRKFWPYDFRLVHRVTVGAQLKLDLIVTNTGSTPLGFEEALHTYYNVKDAHEIRVAGLNGATFRDNTDSNREKQQQGDVVLPKATDNAYLNTTASLELIDSAFKRRIRIVKENSCSTVVWNPWDTGAKALSDMGDDEWRQMVCVEACNILQCKVSLAAGETHAMTVNMEVVPL
jgi:glucose-6-phosphate 1-epimerase